MKVIFHPFILILWNSDTCFLCIENNSQRFTYDERIEGLSKSQTRDCFVHRNRTSGVKFCQRLPHGTIFEASLSNSLNESLFEAGQFTFTFRLFFILLFCLCFEKRNEENEKEITPPMQLEGISFERENLS